MNDIDQSVRDSIKKLEENLDMILKLSYDGAASGDIFMYKINNLAHDCIGGICVLKSFSLK